MTGGALPLLLGLLLGLRHAFEPDHLAAVAAFLGKGKPGPRFQSGRIGALWGAGHALALVAGGSIVILLGLKVPPRIESLLDLLVAAVLIFLGGRILFRYLRHERAHLHVHRHDGVLHAHVHFHHPEEASAHSHHHLFERWVGQGRRPFLMGVLHGLSGTGAATLLVLASSPDSVSALLALGIFAFGTLAGMAGLSWILGFPLALARRSSAALFAGLQIASGLACLLVGAGLAGRILLTP
jgi:ABC-type nickel/cobalt efflux system permease component RcnA